VTLIPGSCSIWSSGSAKARAEQGGSSQEPATEKGGRGGHGHAAFLALLISHRDDHSRTIPVLLKVVVDWFVHRPTSRRWSRAG
jgi:hypothetical protein